MGSQGPAKDCYNCMKRRIRCDKTEPHCKKCAKKNLTCPGYGKRYRFLLINNDADDVALLEQAAVPIPPDLAWVQWSQADEVDDDKSNDAQVDSDDVEDIVRTDESMVFPSWHDDNSPLSYALQPFDAQTRFLLDHFSQSVSPVMLVFDGEANGYRKLILPMAAEDETLRRAVMVAAASHLQSKIPQLKAPAEGGRKAVIQKLRDLSQCSNAASTVFNDLTWATILVLVVGDLITAHEDILILYRMLRTFLNTWDQTTAESSTSSFLRYQSKLIGFFASPMIEEDSEVISHFSSEFELLTWYELTNLDVNTGVNVALYTEVFNNARKIYLHRASSSSRADTEQEVAALVLELQNLLLELDQTVPGAHVLVWPYFVAGAESTDATIGQCFQEKLEYIWRTTGYQNVRVAIRMLDEIWSRQATENWTTVLTQYSNIIM